MFTVIYFTLGGIDYSTGPFAVKFPVEEGHAVLNVSIIDDKILEANESFNLIIDQISVLSGLNVQVFPPYRNASVIIVEDDKSNYYYRVTCVQG